MRLLEAESWWNAGMRDIAATLLQRSKLPRTGMILDVGCGSGQTMLWFEKDHPAWRSAGIDISMEGLKPARSAGLAVAKADAIQLPFPDGVADLVITLDLIQHLRLPDGDMQCMREFARVLMPGCHLFIRTNTQSFPHAADDPVNNFRKYEPAQLEQKLVSAGFEIIVLSRANAVLGFAEIARELSATRSSGTGYHGLLAVPGRSGGLRYSSKRAVLRSEGKLISKGFRFPVGRSIVALCRKPALTNTPPTDR
jgi:SAM-dependent methyltransferase